MYLVKVSIKIISYTVYIIMTTDQALFAVDLSNKFQQNAIWVRTKTLNLTLGSNQFKKYQQKS